MAIVVFGPNLYFAAPALIARNEAAEYPELIETIEPVDTIRQSRSVEKTNAFIESLLLLIREPVNVKHED